MGQTTAGVRVPALTSAVVLLALTGCGGEEAPTTEATVARVADGDTLLLEDGRRVRLVQIDAPEGREGECYAEEATDALDELAPAGASISLEADPTLDDVDRFRRLLRYVIRDGRNVNLALVRRGAAAPWFVGGERGRYADELLEAAEAARRAGRGLWAACPRARLDPTRGLDTGG